jgi:hypothetical protein
MALDMTMPLPSKRKWELSTFQDSLAHPQEQHPAALGRGRIATKETGAEAPVPKFLVLGLGVQSR